MTKLGYIQVRTESTSAVNVSNKRMNRMSDESEELSDMELFQNYMESCVEVAKGGEDKNINLALHIAIIENLQERNFSNDLLDRASTIALLKWINMCDEKTEMNLQMEVLETVLKNKADSLKSTPTKKCK